MTTCPCSRLQCSSNASQGSAHPYLNCQRCSRTHRRNREKRDSGQKYSCLPGIPLLLVGPVIASYDHTHQRRGEQTAISPATWTLNNVSLLGLKDSELQGDGISTMRRNAACHRLWRLFSEQTQNLQATLEDPSPTLFLLALVAFAILLSTHLHLRRRDKFRKSIIALAVLLSIPVAAMLCDDFWFDVKGYMAWSAVGGMILSTLVHGVARLCGKEQLVDSEECVDAGFDLEIERDMLRA